MAEVITLNIKSPQAPLAGLDAFIARLERADTLIDKLARPKPIRVEFAIHGLEKIETVGANVESLTAALRQMGQVRVAEQLNKDITTTGEVSKFAAAEVARLRRELAELNVRATSQQGKFESLTAAQLLDTRKLDILPKVRAELDALDVQRRAVEQQIAGFSRIQGMAESMAGVERATTRTAAAEAKLAPAAEQSADALARQHAVVAQKIATMDRLTASVVGATKAEGQQAAVAQVAAEQRANNIEALLSEKRRINAEGEETLTQRFRTGPGATRTETSGGVTTEERNIVDAFKRRFEQIEAEFGSRRAALAAAGAPAAGREQIAVLTEEATARRAVVSEMQAQGLGAESLAEKQRAASAGIERTAAATTAQLRKQTEAMLDAQLLSRRMQAEFEAFGGKQKRTFEQSDAGGRVLKSKAVREDVTSGVREQIEFVRRFDAAGRELEPTLTKTTNALERTGRGVTSVGATFARNLASVTTWTAAVSTLYGGLHLLSFGFESAVKFNRQFATLQTVFRGTSEEAKALGQQVLELGAINGRAGEEAVDAAIRWSRLGLTQREVAEAVAVSLQAANVAEITAAESAEQLAAIFASYRLEVGDLRTVLNELNTVSNTLNVTNKDLLAGIARTGSIAKQAGIPIAELIGLIGAGVSRTGRSGAEIGNAIKSIIVAVSNPELQKTLREGFAFDVKTPLGQLKDMSEVLAELFVRVQSLDTVSRAEILQKIGGKQQASRLQAILDGYVTAQVKAIQAQRDLNSADRESALIRKTAVSQIQTLSTEFQRLFSVMLEMGGDQSFLAWTANAAGGLGALLRLLSDSKIAGFLVRTAKAGIPGGSLTDVQLPRFGPAREQFGSPELAKARADAGAAEQAARLARNLGTAIGPLAGRDRASAERALREFSMIVGESEKERNLTREELGQLLERNRLDEVRLRLQQLSRGFTERSKSLRADEARYAAAELSALEAQLAAQRKISEERQAQGKSTGPEIKGIEATEAAIERLKGARGEALLKDYGDEGTDPLDTIKKQFTDRSKFRADAIREFFSAIPSIDDSALGKVEQQAQAIRAETEYLQRLQDSQVGAGATTEQQQINLAIMDEVRIRREALALEEDKVSVLRESARLQDEVTTGARDAKARSVAFQIGDNETAQMLAEIRGIGDIGSTGASSRLNAQLPFGDPTAAARAQGEIIGYANRLLEIQVSLGERRWRVERDIANERQRANQEASKALQLASQEDQLRAALLAKFTAGQRFTPESFQFLDKETREAAQKFLPSALPSTFDSKERDLQGERSLLKNFDELSTSLREAADYLRKQAGGGGPKFTTPPPEMGSPNISLQFSDQFQQMTATLASAVDAKLQVQIDEIRSTVQGFIGGLSFASAQSGGAAAINS